MESRIEKGTIKDLNELEALYNSINDYLSQTTNYPGWRKGIYPARVNAEHGIEEDNLYVVRYEDKIVGTIILNHETEQGYDTVQWKVKAEDEEVYIIHTLVVHPDYLKQHIGRLLLQFAEEEGRRNHMKALRLDVYEGNTPAIRLYEKSGFKHIGTVDLGYSSYGLDWFKLYEKSLV